MIIMPHHPYFPASLTLSSPSTLLAAMNLSQSASVTLIAYASGCTHSPPCQLPNPLIASACTLVMRNKFSVSERFADSCASCECRCVYDGLAVNEAPRRACKQSGPISRGHRLTSCLFLTTVPLVAML